MQLAPSTLPSLMQHPNAPLRSGVHPLASETTGRLPKPEDTPPYKTFPFMLGTLGAAVGAAIGALRNLKRPQHFEGQQLQANRRLTLSKHSDAFGQPLAAYQARPLHPEASAKASLFAKDTGRYSSRSVNDVSHVVATTPFFYQGAELRYQKEEVQAGETRIRSIDFPPNAPLHHWTTTADPFHQGKEAVYVAPKTPLTVQKGEPAHKVLRFLRDPSSGDMHWVNHETTLIPVELNAQHEIQNAPFEALNGLPVWFESGLKDPEAFARNPRHYIQQLKEGLLEHTKPVWVSPAKWGASLAIGGYATGWILEWFSRKKANEHHQKTPKSVAH